MEWRDDVRLAECVSEIDLILGGHDHQYGVQVVRGKNIVKSGTEFRYLSLVNVNVNAEGEVTTKVDKEDITSEIEKSGDINSGANDENLSYVWMVSMYLWWAVKYHGYKRYAKLKRTLSCCRILQGDLY